MPRSAVGVTTIQWLKIGCQGGYLAIVTRVQEELIVLSLPSEALNGSSPVKMSYTNLAPRPPLPASASTSSKIHYAPNSPPQLYTPVGAIPLVNHAPPTAALSAGQDQGQRWNND